jgi:hypothetical protein
MTQHGGDRSVHRMVLRLTARGLGMQQRLFGPDILGLAPVSDAGLGRVLHDLSAASELQSFRIWLVGSRLEPGRTGSDIDLVLSPRPGALPSEDLIEYALWYCREYGLYGAIPACVIDPCFRGGGPTVALVPLRPHVRIKTVKLLSPRLADLAMRGRMRECRRVGDVGIEFVRRAGDTDYYGKLPCGDFDGLRWPYLRPAIEIIPADNDDLPTAIHASRQMIAAAGDNHGPKSRSAHGAAASAGSEAVRDGWLDQTPALGRPSSSMGTDKTRLRR